MKKGIYNERDAHKLQVFGS